jgi:hypothetical protein
VIQWADLLVAGKIWRIARGVSAVIAESGSIRLRPHCRRPGTLSPLAHNTLPPLF